MNTQPNRPQPHPGVLRIDRYVPGKSAATGGEKVFKLSSNESPLGASPKAQEAYRSLAGELEFYPDGSSGKLRDTIAEIYGLNPERLLCGNGSDELLGLLAQAYVGPGNEAIYTKHGFLMYRIAINASGGIPVVADETNLTADVDSILAKISTRTRLVYLANPNNPTGTYLPHDEVRRLHAGLPPHVLLVIDAAYAEYVRRNDYEAGIELVANADNVVMTRTFSKIHGLANLRLGWMYGPEHVIDALDRIRGPFNVTGPAMAAGIASLRDREFIEAAADHNDLWLPWLSEELTSMGLTVTPSVGNFILIHFPRDPEHGADAACARLMASGVIPRQVANYGLPDALRMSIGSEEANRLAVEVLRSFLADRPT